MERQIKTVSIHQPNFMPWFGYFIKVLNSDQHVLLDDVQFTKNNWINRNIIHINSTKYLTIPVVKKDHNKKINEVRLAENYKFVLKKIRKTIDFNFQTLSGYPLVYDLLLKIEDKKFSYISELNIFLLENFFKILGINNKIIYSSNLDLNLTTHKNERLLEILNSLSCTNYVTGIGSKNYLDIKLFKEKGIKVIFLDELQVSMKKFNISENSILEFILKNGGDSKKVLNEFNTYYKTIINKI